MDDRLRGENCCAILLFVVLFAISFRCGKTILLTSRDSAGPSTVLETQTWQLNQHYMYPSELFPQLHQPLDHLSFTLRAQKLVCWTRQRRRLSRHRNSALSFASFGPHVATYCDPAHGISGLSLTEDSDRCRLKRIVIDNVPGHGSRLRLAKEAEAEKLRRQEEA
jgi:hypothetical protein